MQFSNHQLHASIITRAYSVETLRAWLHKLYPGKSVTIVGAKVLIDAVELKGLEVRENGRTVELWTA